MKSDRNDDGPPHWLVESISYEGLCKRKLVDTSSKSCKMQKNAKKVGLVLNTAIRDALPMKKCIAGRRKNSLTVIKLLSKSISMQISSYQRRRSYIMQELRGKLYPMLNVPDEKRTGRSILHFSALNCHFYQKREGFTLQSKWEREGLSGLRPALRLYENYIQALALRYKSSALDTVCNAWLDGALCFYDGFCGVVERDFGKKLVINLHCTHAQSYFNAVACTRMESSEDHIFQTIWLEKESDCKLLVGLPGIRWSTGTKRTHTAQSSRVPCVTSLHNWGKAYFGLGEEYTFVFVHLKALRRSELITT